ncbi:MAG TPA: protein-disulfide reductase DsbD domain-containing protein [Phycisphaeraceae bacterium]
MKQTLTLAAGVALLLLHGLVSPRATAQRLARTDDMVQVEAVWSIPEAKPGDQRALALVLNIREGFHINPDSTQVAPGLIPTTVQVEQAPPSLRLGPLQWPAPHTITVNYTGEPQSIPVYEGRVIVYVPVTVDDAASAEPAPLRLGVRYQACNDRTCWPPRTQSIETALTIVPPEAAISTTPADPALFADFDAEAAAQASQASQSAPQEASNPVRFDVFGLNFSLHAAGAGFLLLLAVTAAGGLLLNFTPCVLPVIPLKILGLSAAAGSRARCLALGTSMSLGVVAFWMGLGGAIALTAGMVQRGVLNTGSGITATNQLFQYPLFCIGVGVVIAIMAVAMCGLFAIQLPRVVYQFNPRHDTLTGSFGFGIMTAVLSTPCTAPLMGSAAAWAVGERPTVTLTVFASIGAGMALPYLVLSAWPQWARRMPRSGPGSELLKQVMGLLMLAAAAYFIGVGASALAVQPPEPPSLLYWWPVFAFVIAAAAWLAYRAFRITQVRRWRLTWATIAAIAIASSLYAGVRLTDPGPIRWVHYTPQRFQDALDRGQVVVMDFTAEWCLNCKALEHSVLYREPVAQALAQEGVTPMKVDLTGDNPEGDAMLQAVGRVAIPVLVVFDPSGREVFNSDFYTVNQVLEAIEQARSSTRRAAAGP